MLLAIAFVCFGAQVLAWLLLPSSARNASEEVEPEMRYEVEGAEATAA